MPATRKHRARRSSSLVGLFSVAVSLLVSCGGAEKFELTLRSRYYDSASTNPLETQWLTADGRHATSPGGSDPFRGGAEAEVGAVECGGQRWPRHFFTVLGPAPSRDNSFELKFDDGNRLTLDPESAVMVYLYDVDCFEEAGRWKGTAADLRNHGGTFTLHYDSIQTVLRIVED
jgi:hypothetical protein